MEATLTQPLGQSDEISPIAAYILKEMASNTGGRVTRAQQLDGDEPMELPVASPHDHRPAADANAVQEVKTTPQTLFRPIKALPVLFVHDPSAVYALTRTVA